MLVAPGEQVAFTPAYPPFFSGVAAGRSHTCSAPLTASGEADLDALEASFAGGVRILVLTTRTIRPARLCRDRCWNRSPTCASHTLRGCLRMRFTLPWSLRVRPIRHGLRSQMQRERGIAHLMSKAFNVAGLKAALVITASDRARDVVRRYHH